MWKWKNACSLSSSHLMFNKAYLTTIPPERDYYQILGVEKTATQMEIKKAFYTKSKQFHPDHHCDAHSTVRFVELKTAYDILRRPADRRLYDMRERGNTSNTSYRQDHHYYYHYHHPPQYEHSNDWKNFWKENPGAAGPMKDSEHQKRSDRQLKIILKWTLIGTIIVVLYNLGYVWQIRYREYQLSKLVDEDEIAKSFLRQSEFRDKLYDSQEVESFARLLKSDVDEAWRRRNEELSGKNHDEIREEYRWLRAVQDVDHNRRIKSIRLERKRHNEEEERVRLKQPSTSF